MYHSHRQNAELEFFLNVILVRWDIDEIYFVVLYISKKILLISTVYEC